MQPVTETPNLGPVTISQHFAKHFNTLCDVNIKEVLVKKP